jgi:prepilin-type N-terminal cleavage/methylation domain-containing protein
MKQQKGFTLMEILLVIGLLAVLAVVVFVALDPAKRFQDTRNARRTTDIQNILSAVHTYVNDTKGTFPAAITATEKQIGTAATGCAIATGGCAVAGATDCVDLGTALGNYLKSIPVDPNGTAALTGYSIVKDANNMVTVRACNAEGGMTILTSR